MRIRKQLAAPRNCGESSLLAPYLPAGSFDGASIGTGAMIQLGRHVRFWNLMRAGPKQIAMPIAERRVPASTGETAELQALRSRRPPGAAESGPSGRGQARRRVALSLRRRLHAGIPGLAPQDRRTSCRRGRCPRPGPNYRLAPRAPVLRRRRRRGCRPIAGCSRKGAEPTRTVIAGDSAGGGLAVATVIAARDRAPAAAGRDRDPSAWADLTCSGDSMTSRAATDIE